MDGYVQTEIIPFWTKNIAGPVNEIRNTPSFIVLSGG